ncbi:metalloprotease [Salegentibacter chungangensis]|uniref:Metalloprotease n=1 Tax=Salegentibacter chungangensis TaxID=1335724 RepID=A0ABW3NVH8_9FLAO
MKGFLLYFILLAGISCGFAQNQIDINAELDVQNHSFYIQQQIKYTNTSDQALNEIYLNDWANAFKHKVTPLARRFAEEYVRRFHFAREEERGSTLIFSIAGNRGNFLNWDRPAGYPDILKIELDSPLKPGETYTLQLNYKVKVPSDKFTRFGVDNEKNFKLRYWYLTPVVYNEGWQFYSHKNLGNQYNSPYDIKISLKIPENYHIGTALNQTEIVSEEKQKTLKLEGSNRVDSKIYITNTQLFDDIVTEGHQIVTNVEDDGLQTGIKGLIVQRIMRFLEQRLGEYPHKKLFVTREDYLNSPVYGLNQLPNFIRPFPDGFQYDIKQMKTITSYFLKNTLLVNPRDEQWVNDAIMISLMMDYVDTYYPKMKLIGNLSDIIGVRWFHAADLEFNDQYQFLYMNMARMNLDQPLTMAQDSLVKFNRNIANSYKAGVGIKYLEDYLTTDAVKESVSEFYKNYHLKVTPDDTFEEILKKNTTKDISWFFEDYVGSNQKIDFRIKNVEKTEDSLRVTVLNKKDNRMPVSLYGLNDGNITYKVWVDNFEKEKTVSLPRGNIERVALNYEKKIPEFNQRDNYKRVSTFLNKPLQFRLFQDIEDPRYTQIFFMPEFEYNLYDGVAIGPKVYNKTILAKNFQFEISPKFGFTSKTVVGSASVMNTHQFENEKLYAIRYGVGGTRFSYGYDLFYNKYSPFLIFAYRNKYLRDNEHQSLMIRNVSVQRDLDPENPVDEPNYNVFNVKYRYSNPHMSHHTSATFDYQLAEKFSKISLSLEYRKLFRSNRQINLRFFAGTFLYNDDRGDDYFSFALDRPTDYLFDYNYYGRSQGSGLFSQQFIMAEGGFKSKLQPAFANQWLGSVNASTNLWKWIFVYGDMGLVKNKHQDAKFLYDSGVRVSLVSDYFEVFFPVYSNLGWEVGQPNYDQKIRFIVALDLNTLIKLFTRRWY